MTLSKRSATACIQRIRDILASARADALRTVNAAMVGAYWEIGREIVEEEPHGAERATYGSQLIAQLSARLSVEFGKGFSVTNLKFIRQFYATYSDRTPPIGYSPSSQSAESSFSKSKATHDPGGIL